MLLKGAVEASKGSGKETTTTTRKRNMNKNREAARGVREEQASTRAEQVTTQTRSNKQKQEELEHARDKAKGESAGVNDVEAAEVLDVNKRGPHGPPQNNDRIRGGRQTR